MDAVIQNSDATTYPKGLVTAEELAGRLKNVLTVRRIMELAEAEYMPCWVIDDNYRFQVTDVKKWLTANFVIHRKGAPFPKALAVPTLPLHELGRVPEALVLFSGSLHRLPLEYSGLPCVYFLVDQGEVVYVGQSCALIVRIAEHNRQGKVFDSVFYLPVPKSDLSSVESSFMVVLKPKLNAPSQTHRELHDIDRERVGQFQVTPGGK